MNKVKEPPKRPDYHCPTCGDDIPQIWAKKPSRCPKPECRKERKHMLERGYSKKKYRKIMADPVRAASRRAGIAKNCKDYRARHRDEPGWLKRRADNYRAYLDTGHNREMHNMRQLLKYHADEEFKAGRQAKQRAYNEMRASGPRPLRACGKCGVWFVRLRVKGAGRKYCLAHLPRAARERMYALMGAPA